MKNREELNFLLNELEQKGIQVETEKFKKMYFQQNVRTVFIKIISVLSGFLALGMLSVFLGITGILDNEYVLFIMGVILLIVSYVIMRNKDNAISDGLCISVYITGFFAVIASVAIFSDMDNEWIYFILFLSILGLCMFKNRIIIFLNSLGIYISVHWIIISNHVNSLFYIYLLLLVAFSVFLLRNESKIRTLNQTFNLYYPSLLTASFVYSLLMSIISSTDIFSSYYRTDSRVTLYVLMIGFLIISLFAIHMVLQKLKIKSILIKACTYLTIVTFLYLLGFYYPAFAVGFIYALWAFQNQFKIGLILAACTFLWSVGMYYYDLNITLHSKSVSLMLSGGLFLGIYWVIHKNWNKDETK